jgi:hypothetical protein
MFQMLSHGIFFFSNKRRKKQRKKTVEKEKNVKKGGSFLSSSHSAFSLLAPASAFPLLPFYFEHFFLASSSSQAGKNKKPIQCMTPKGDV